MITDEGMDLVFVRSPIQGDERWSDTHSAHWADTVDIIKHVAEATARKLARDADNE